MVKCCTIKCINQWVNRILREAKYFRVSGRWKGILDKNNKPPLFLLIQRVEREAFNRFRSLKESVNTNMPVPFLHPIKINRRIKVVS